MWGFENVTIKTGTNTYFSNCHFSYFATKLIKRFKVKLPLNCSVNYYSDFLSETEGWELYNLLLNKYKIDEARLVVEAGGQLIETDSFKILFATQELIDRKSHPEYIHGKNYPWTGFMVS